MTPAIAPLRAKTMVPTRSSTSRSVSIVGSPLLPQTGRPAALQSPTGPDRPHGPPYGASQARPATINASTPVCKVGWITGAKRRLWLVGFRRACLPAWLSRSGRGRCRRRTRTRRARAIPRRTIRDPRWLAPVRSRVLGRRNNAGETRRRRASAPRTLRKCRSWPNSRE